MATQVIKWVSEDGKSYDNKEHAEAADMIYRIANFLGQFKVFDEFDAEAAAIGLLEHYTIQPRKEQQR